MCWFTAFSDPTAFDLLGKFGSRCEVKLDCQFIVSIFFVMSCALSSTGAVGQDIQQHCLSCHSMWSCALCYKASVLLLFTHLCFMSCWRAFYLLLLQLLLWQRLPPDIIPVLQQNRLQSYMLQKEDNDWMKKCMEYEVEGARPRGKAKKTRRPRLWKKIRYINWTRRMPFIVKDGASR